MKLKAYFSLIKFSHTVFALPFALLGFVLGLQQENWVFSGTKLLLVILCMISARTAAMAFNRYIDRHFDAQNPRTATREIPAGVINPNQALMLVILSSLCFVVFAGMINQLCLMLSPIALIIILGYSLTKRFTALCHLVLGAGLALAPIGAYLAVHNQFDVVPVMFSIIVFLWVSGFDIIYALQDEEFDKSIQLKSIPVYLGKVNALRLSRFMHFVCCVLLLLVGWKAQFGNLYYLACAVFIGLIIFQQSIVKATDLSRVNLAFGTTNGIASIIYCLLAIFAIVFNV